MVWLKRSTLQNGAAELEEVWVMKEFADGHEETRIVGLEDWDVCVLVN